MTMQNKKPFGKASRTSTGTVFAPAAKAPPNVELRHTARKRTLLKGRLVYGYEAAFSADCVILDFSDAGARIAVEPTITIPEEVTLLHLRENIAFIARVVWRHASGHLGLSFTARHDLKDADTPELKALRNLCVEHSLRSSAAAD